MDTDQIVEWWKSANKEDRVLFTERLIKLVGQEKFYLMMVEAVGGEEELARLVTEARRQASLS